MAIRKFKLLDVTFSLAILIVWVLALFLMLESVVDLVQDGKWGLVIACAIGIGMLSWMIPVLIKQIWKELTNG